MKVTNESDCSVAMRFMLYAASLFTLVTILPLQYLIVKQFQASYDQLLDEQLEFNYNLEAEDGLFGSPMKMSVLPSPLLHEDEN